jgi:hypothetical protein
MTTATKLKFEATPPGVKFLTAVSLQAPTQSRREPEMPVADPNWLAQDLVYRRTGRGYETEGAARIRISAGA